MSTRRVRAGWERLSAPGPRGRWRGDASGRRACRCALYGQFAVGWPQWRTDPAQPELLIVSHNRLGFRRLVDAQAAVEQIAAGILELVPSGVYVGSQVRCATPRAA